MNNKFLLAAIFSVSFFVRVIWVNQAPPSLNWDEVSHGYNAYSILKTGTDEWGKSFPLIFRAYGDYKLPVYVYSTVPSVAIFGLSAFAVKLPSILAGSLSVLFLYLLTYELFKNKKAAYLAALLMAFEPWSLFLSRVALEANLALFLIISGFFVLIKSLKNKNNYLFIGVFLLGLSTWTYNSARIFVPLLLIAFAFIYRDLIFKYIKQKKASSIVSILLAIFIFGAMFFQLLTTEGSARYDNVKILNRVAIGEIEANRNETSLSPLISKFTYNKYAFFISSFAKNYISHFNINYLFKNGGDNYQFNLQDEGLLYAFNLPLIIIGVIYLLLNKNKKNSKAIYFLISWVLLAPVASSLTKESPHTLRNIVMMPTPFIFSAFGLLYFISLFKNSRKKYIYLLVICIFVLSVVGYLNKYFNSYPKEYSQSWQYGYKQVSEYINNNYSKYDKIIITKKYGEPHEFLLFYLKWDPNNYINNKNLIRFYQSNWYWVDRFDKFLFMNDWDIPNNQSQKWILESEEEFNIEGEVLLITSPGNYPENWTLLERINFLDNTPAFDIVTK